MRPLLQTHQRRHSLPHPLHGWRLRPPRRGPGRVDLFERGGWIAESKNTRPLWSSWATGAPGVGAPVTVPPARVSHKKDELNARGTPHLRVGFMDMRLSSAAPKYSRAKRSQGH